MIRATLITRRCWKDKNHDRVTITQVCTMLHKQTTKQKKQKGMQGRKWYHWSILLVIDQKESKCMKYVKHVTKIDP